MKNCQSIQSEYFFKFTNWKYVSLEFRKSEQELCLAIILRFLARLVCVLVADPFSRDAAFENTDAARNDHFYHPFFESGRSPWQTAHTRWTS